MNEDSRYLAPYRHPTMRIFTTLMAEAVARIKDYDLMLTEPERGEEALSGIEDLRQDKRKQIDWLHTMRESGFFAEEALCGEKDYWIDWDAYYEDQADKCFAELEAMKELKAFALGRQDTSPAMIEEIDKQIEKFTRFAHANLKKAGIPSLQRKIRQVMREKHNE